MKKQGLDFGYGLKSTLAQCLVLTTTYFLNVQQGIDLMMPTVIIDAISNKTEDTLDKITDEQLSWIGSLVYLSPPLGSLCLSLIQARLGHRLCMMLTNCIQLSPVFVVIMFPVTANSLYTCSILMGLSTGFATGLSVSFSSEVCEPKLRGSLTSALNVFFFIGYFFVATTYALTNSWKLTMLVTVMMPIIGIIGLILTPDSPIWLLSKGKTDKARKVLKKLRGNVSDEKCDMEFQEMIQYVSQINQSGGLKQKLSADDGHSDLGLWRPLKIMIVYIFFSNIMSGVPYLPYLVDTFRFFKTPIDAAWATTIYTGFSVVGNIFTILLVNRLGKRCLVLWSITMCSFSSLFIGIIGYTYVYTAYSEIASWTILSLFCVCTFSSSIGIMPIGWILMGELFPMKCKNLGCSISAGVYYLFCFIMTRFYRNFESFVGTYNVFLLIGSVGLSGLVYFYLNLPETENKTLKEIAEHFAGRKPGQVPATAKKSSRWNVVPT